LSGGGRVYEATVERACNTARLLRKVVGIAFAVAIFSWGISFYGLSVCLHALHEERGWPVATIASAITTHFLVGAAIVACLAEAHRRFGIAAVTRFGVLATALGLCGWGFAFAPWQVFVAAAVTGAGWAATSGAAINAMVSPWFDRRRPAALSHALNGAPLWATLIGTFGIGPAAMLVGAVMLAILWPLAGSVLRPTPATRGLLADGELASAATSKPPQQRSPLRLGALLCDRRFITLSAAFAFALFVQVGLITHLVTRLAPIFGDAAAAAAVSLTATCAVAGRMALGAYIGNADRRIAAAGNLAMQAAGTSLLAFGSGAPSLIAGAVLFGLGIGNVVSLPPLIAQVEFDRADVPRVVALVTAINQMVFAFAPAIIGILHELSSGYALAFSVTAGVQIAAAAIVLSGCRSRKSVT
jgi:hypothetical protein